MLQYWKASASASSFRRIWEAGSSTSRTRRHTASKEPKLRAALPRRKTSTKTRAISIISALDYLCRQRACSLLQRYQILRPTADEEEPICREMWTHARPKRVLGSVSVAWSTAMRDPESWPTLRLPSHVVQRGATVIVSFSKLHQSLHQQTTQLVCSEQRDSVVAHWHDSLQQARHSATSRRAGPPRLCGQCGDMALLPAIIALRRGPLYGPAPASAPPGDGAVGRGKAANSGEEGRHWHRRHRSCQCRRDLDCQLNDQDVQRIPGPGVAAVAQCECAELAQANPRVRVRDQCVL